MSIHQLPDSSYNVYALMDCELELTDVQQNGMSTAVPTITATLHVSSMSGGDFTVIIGLTQHLLRSIIKQLNNVEPSFPHGM